MRPVGYYRRLRNSQLIAIPLVVAALFLALILILGVPLGREFKGGSLVMVQGGVPDPGRVKSVIGGSLGRDVDVVLVENGIHIETDALNEIDKANLKEALFSQLGIPENSVTIEPLGPTISGLQGEQMLYSLVIAFVVIGIITLVIFRCRAVPMAVLLVIGLDIFSLLGYMALFRVPLSPASMIGILMLVGYGIDTNVLLAHRMLKQVGGEPRAQATASMTAGLMMGLLLVVIFSSVNLLTSAVQLDVLTFMIIFGVAMNIFNTWFLGAGILLRYAERQRGKGYHVSL